MGELLSANGEPLESETGAPTGGDVAVPQEVTNRRGFLRAAMLGGGGAGLTAAFSYGRPEQSEAAEGLYIAADDPEFPEEQNLSPIVNGEESVGMMELAEQMTDMVKSGAMELDAEQEAGLLAAGGLAGVAMLGNKEGAQVQKVSRGAMIKAFMAGAVLFTVSQFAKAQELALVTYNYNSNARDNGEPPGDELRQLERARGRRISLEEFTRLDSCESPRAARLFAQHEEVLRYNKVIEEGIRTGVGNLGTPKESPIAMFKGWYRKPSTRPGSSIKYSFFRLRDQVLVKGQDGQQRSVYKHYGVGQIPESTTRQPHDLFWAGYMGTDQSAALQGMTGMIAKL